VALGSRTYPRQGLVWGSGPLLAVPCINAAGQGAILFWDTQRQAAPAPWGGDFDLRAMVLALSPHRQRPAPSDAEGIRIYDLATQSEVLRLPGAQRGAVGMLRWLADGRLLSADFFGNSYTIWEPSGPSLTSLLTTGTQRVSDLAFRPRSRWLAIL